MSEKYTYAVAVVAPDVGQGELERNLRNAGARGWELVAIVTHATGDFWYHFKRDGVATDGAWGHPFAPVL